MEKSQQKYELLVVVIYYKYNLCVHLKHIQLSHNDLDRMHSNDDITLNVVLSNICLTVLILNFSWPEVPES